MADSLIIADLKNQLLEHQVSGMVGWNRLEGRPRARDIGQALRAEVRDAMWLLTRQWQMGEFKGDDAGSPIAAAPVITRSTLERYQSGDAAASGYSSDLPPEAIVEARPINFVRAGQPMSLDIRLQMGRMWFRMIAGLGDFASQYAQLYKVLQPDVENRAHANICAHADVWQSYAAASGRLMDGYLFYQHLVAGNPASSGINGLASDLKKIDDKAAAFLAWFERQYVEPKSESADAWYPERLEYSFRVSTPTESGEKVLSADEYFHGRLDWYNYNIDKTTASLGVTGLHTLVATAQVPMPLTFPGMPDTRWWAFEDGKTNLGKTEASTTDLGRMLFLEFALLYANDWYMMPLTVPCGSLATVKGIAVTNVFGERFWVAPAGEGVANDWQRWTMFTSSIKGTGNEIADTGIFAAAVVPKVQEGKQCEEVLLTRDEMVNMVWGIEKTVPMPDGRSKVGREAAGDLRAHFERAIKKPTQTKPDASILRYDVMSSVAENWIPFLAAHDPTSDRQMLLQRGSMLRLMDGDKSKPRRITPKTSVLRAGLDQTPQLPYFIAEEEVPRAGSLVSGSFQRTRWRFGHTCVWYGMRKRVGRGEGASGLEFDQARHEPKS
jgi:hypothetical protein